VAVAVAILAGYLALLLSPIPSRRFSASHLTQRHELPASSDA